MAIFKGAKNRDDTFVGGGRPDTFLFDPADLTNGDTIVGGGGRRADALQFTAAGAIGASSFVSVSGIERIVLADGTNSIVLNDALVSTANGARVQVVGGSGDDLVYAATLTGANAVDIVAGGGADLLLGGLGADSFTFVVSELDALDVVTALNGGTADRLVLTGSGSLSAAQLAGVTGIEAIDLGDGGVQIALAESMARSAEGNNLTVTGGAGADTIDASLIAFDPANFPSWRLFGGGGDDVIIGTTGFGSYIDGGAGADTIDAGLASVVYDGADVHEIVTEGGYLVVNGKARIDLTNVTDQSARDTAIVQGFNSIDASKSKESVDLTGLSFSTLLGGTGDDVLTGGSHLRGGKGADVMTAGDAGSSAAFFIDSGDFARGETIVGNGIDDQIGLVGSADFRRGSVQGIEDMFVTSGGNEHTHIVVSALMAESLNFISFGRQNETETLAVDYYLDRNAPVDAHFAVYGGTLTIHGTAADEVIATSDATVLGGGGNDMISNDGVTYGEGGNDILKGNYGQFFGGDGDDIIDTDFAAIVSGDAGNDSIMLENLYDGYVIDGGSGTDSLTVEYWYSSLTEIDLASKDNQAVGSDAIVRNFENIDLTGFYSNLVINGSSAANVITGGSSDDVIHGGGGDDVLTGGGRENGDTLDGGAGDDLIYVAGGFYGVAHFAGGAGADTFFSDSRDHTYGQLGIITDFKPGQDHLGFGKNDFDFDGKAFDHRVVADNISDNITGADLVIYTGGRLDSENDVIDYLNAAAGGGRNEGVFVAGLDSRGHTVLYHAIDASFTQSHDVAGVVDLGRIGNPAETLTLNDFSFI